MDPEFGALKGNIRQYYTEMGQNDHVCRQTDSIEIQDKAPVFFQGS